MNCPWCGAECGTREGDKSIFAMCDNCRTRVYVPNESKAKMKED